MEPTYKISLERNNILYVEDMETDKVKRVCEHCYNIVAYSSIRRQFFRPFMSASEYNDRLYHSDEVETCPHCGKKLIQASENIIRIPWYNPVYISKSIHHFDDEDRIAICENLVALYYVENKNLILHGTFQQRFSFNKKTGQSYKLPLKRLSNACRIPMPKDNGFKNITNNSLSSINNNVATYIDNHVPYLTDKNEEYKKYIHCALDINLAKSDKSSAELVLKNNSRSKFENDLFDTIVLSMNELKHAATIYNRIMCDKELTEYMKKCDARIAQILTYNNCCADSVIMKHIFYLIYHYRNHKSVKIIDLITFYENLNINEESEWYYNDRISSIFWFYKKRDTIDPNNIHRKYSETFIDKFLPLLKEKEIRMIAEKEISLDDIHTIFKGFQATKEYKKNLEALECYDSKTSFRKKMFRPYLENALKAKKELTEKFKKKYHGRVPKCLMDLIVHSGKDTETIFEKFNLNMFRKVMSTFKNSNRYRSTINRYENHFFNLGTIIKFYYNSDPINLLKMNLDVLLYANSHNLMDNPVYKWLESMADRKYSYQKQMKVINHADVLEDNINDFNNIESILTYISSSSSALELKKIENKYKFKLEDREFLLPQTRVSNDKYTARMLEKDEAKMTTIGYDTYCCQHLHGAGESAMMYGILAPKGGFWVIENKYKTVIAQAEMWEGKLHNKDREEDKTVLVFDNIEFANSRNIENFYPLLSDWLRSSKYENIVMGTGYNEAVDNDMEYVKERLIQPRIPDAKKFNLTHVYTDAHRCVWLKKNNEVMIRESDSDKRVA